MNIAAMQEASAMSSGLHHQYYNHHQASIMSSEEEAKRAAAAAFVGAPPESPSWSPTTGHHHQTGWYPSPPGRAAHHVHSAPGHFSNEWTPVNMLSHCAYGPNSFSSSGHGVASSHMASVAPYPDPMSRGPYHYSPYNVAAAYSTPEPSDHGADVGGSNQDGPDHRSTAQHYSSLVTHHHLGDLSVDGHSKAQLNQLSPIETKPLVGGGGGLVTTDMSGGHQSPGGLKSSDEELNSAMSNTRPQAARSPFEWMKKSAYNSGPAPGKTRTRDKYRVVYSDHQRTELEKEFFYSRYITIRRKSELAGLLALSERQVKIWFQNRRAKERKQQKKKNEMGGKLDKDTVGAQMGLGSSVGSGNGSLHHHHHHHHLIVAAAAGYGGSPQGSSLPSHQSPPPHSGSMSHLMPLGPPGHGY